ncbi:unnamed protein product [Meganyctiphanes norvegica]|uniref:Uncharacterized protein n=1 Tax=Meganyctiphanes norvegica TaxID=48144 RepID=A0AAV2SDS7_MEGNR
MSFINLIGRYRGINFCGMYMAFRILCADFSFPVVFIVNLVVILCISSFFDTLILLNHSIHILGFTTHFYVTIISIGLFLVIIKCFGITSLHIITFMILVIITICP